MPSPFLPIALGASQGVANVFQQQQDEQQHQEETKYRYDLMNAMYGRKKPLNLGQEAKFMDMYEYADGSPLKADDAYTMKNYDEEGDAKGFTDLVKQKGIVMKSKDASSYRFRSWMNQQDIDKDLLKKVTDSVDKRRNDQAQALRTFSGNPAASMLGQAPPDTSLLNDDNYNRAIQNQYGLLKATYKTKGVGQKPFTPPVPAPPSTIDPEKEKENKARQALGLPPLP